MADRRIDSLSAAVPIFAGATAIFALVALLQLIPGSGMPAILPLAQQHLDRAALILNGRNAHDPVELEKAKAETYRALSESPARADAWLNIAYIEEQLSGRYTPKVAKALDNSYAVGPLDPDVSLWRLSFCFNHWSDLTHDLKNDVLRELSAVWTRPNKRDELRQIAEKLTSPAGQRAMNLQIALLERGRGDLRTP